MAGLSRASAPRAGPKVMVTFMVLPIFATTAPFSIWTWSFDPGVILGVYIAGFFYYRAVGPRRTRWFPDSEPAGVRRIVSFYSAMAALLIALVSPLGVLADDYLLTAHMIQHLLITIVVPVLFYAGIPVWMYAPLVRRKRVWRVWRTLTHPILAFALFQIPFAVSHAPVFYDLTLRYQPVHIAEHVWFIASAFLVWWPIMAPGREYGQLAPIMQVVYLFFQTIPGQIVGAMITMSETPLYPEYVHATRALGLSVLADQQAGGLIMWIGTGTLYLAALMVVFFRWANREEANERWVGANEVTKPS